MVSGSNLRYMEVQGHEHWNKLFQNSVKLFILVAQYLSVPAIECQWYIYLLFIYTKFFTYVKCKSLELYPEKMSFTQHSYKSVFIINSYP